MHGEVVVVEVADVDGAGAVVGELVGGGAADAEGGVDAGDDDDFVLHSSVYRILICRVSFLGNLDSGGRGRRVG